jgi:hypothetical protein
VGTDGISRGQDGDVHMHINPAPPAKRRRAQRTTEQLLLTLRPADAAAIRITAELLGMTLSAYIVRLVAAAGDPMKLARERDQHVEAAQLAAAVHQRLEIVRRARADFGRAGGLVKSLLVRDDDTRERAEGNAHELSDALREFVAIGKRLEEMLEEIGDDVAPIFSDIAAAARRLSGR